MTLRDYFAAKAMQAIVSHPNTGGMTYEDISDRAWVQADAMLKARDAAPVQEPVAWVTGFYAGRCVIKTINPAAILPVGVALYTTPPAAQRQWVGLTDEEIEPYYAANKPLIKWVETKLKAKNT